MQARCILLLLLHNVVHKIVYLYIYVAMSKLKFFQYIFFIIILFFIYLILQ